MKTRKYILKILLSAFVFIALHDFVIGYLDADTQVEIYVNKIEKIHLCKASVLHEHIHQSIMDIPDLNSAELSIDNRVWVFYTGNSFFASDFRLRLYRPPLA